MPEKIENLEDFLMAIIGLLKLIEKSSPLLFRSNFRTNYSHSLEEVLPRLDRLKKDAHIQFPTNFETMNESGLTGNQLDLKLESFGYSYIEFHQEGGLENLIVVLEKGLFLLNNITSAVPGFGSFAQELIDFIIKELKQQKI